MSQNRIKRIAIVGAGGRSGIHIAEALIESGRFEVTAITRPDSTSSMPAGLTHIAKVDYNDHAFLVSALTNQDCLLITMSVFAAQGSQQKLIAAAADANVPWILPNEWGVDHSDDVVARESMIGGPIRAAQQQIRELGKSSYISFICGFWYEYSLTAGPWAYGFDWDKKKVTFFDKGETKINTTTWPKVAQGVVALLSLPVSREQGSDGPVLDDFKNAPYYVSSFRLTQREMFESILRVTDAKEDDWTIEYENVKQRYADGQAEMAQGRREGFGKCLYSRLFYPDGPGDFEGQGYGDNKRLGPKQEDLDERTKIAVKMHEETGPIKLDG